MIDPQSIACGVAAGCARGNGDSAGEDVRVPADVTQDRRVTDLVQGPNLPALSDGSRLLWALPSPVHEELGYGRSRPTGYKVMRCSPLPSLTAPSRITSAQSSRSTSRTPKPRAVIAIVKAAARRLRRSAASLDHRCARRTTRPVLGTKKPPRSNKETDSKKAPAK
jgi:hypothetical protein